MNSKFYKCCAVPLCGNNTKKTPEKLFIHVPRTKNNRKKWLQLAWRDPALVPIQSKMYFCEDHFNLPNDMKNYTEYHIMGSVSQVLMKTDCLPSKFECQPDRKSQIDANTTSTQSFVAKRQRLQIIAECEQEIGGDSQSLPMVDVLPGCSCSASSTSIQVEKVPNSKRKPNILGKRRKHLVYDQTTDKASSTSIPVEKVPNSKHKPNILAKRKKNLVYNQTTDKVAKPEPVICRLCLRTGVKMNKLNSIYLTYVDMILKQHGFDKEVNGDYYACFVCTALLTKTYSFTQMVVNAHTFFTYYVSQINNEVPLNKITNVNRDEIGVSYSDLSTTSFELSIDPTDIPHFPIENDIPIENEIEIEEHSIDIKKESSDTDSCPEDIDIELDSVDSITRRIQEESDTGSYPEDFELDNNDHRNVEGEVRLCGDPAAYAISVGQDKFQTRSPCTDVNKTNYKKLAIYIGHKGKIIKESKFQDGDFLSKKVCIYN